MTTTEQKLWHQFGKMRALPARHQERAINALAEIAEDFYMQDDEPALPA